MKKSEQARIDRLDMQKMEQFEVYSNLLGNPTVQSIARNILVDITEFDRQKNQWRKEFPEAFRIAEYAHTLGITETEICDYLNWKAGFALGPDYSDLFK